MQSRNLVKMLLGPALILVAVAIAWGTRETWKPWLLHRTSGNDGDTKPPTGAGPERVKISEQARRNLRLDVKEATLTTYWKRIYLPGAVVDRPGHSDRGVPAPIAGVVTQVNALPGKTVKAGDELFRL